MQEQLVFYIISTHVSKCFWQLKQSSICVCLNICSRNNLVYIYRIFKKMPLRILSHSAFSGSYESQLLNELDVSDLEDIIYDIKCHSHGVFGESSTPIAATLTKIGWCAIAYKVSSLLDGNLTRKTADICRHAYNLIRKYNFIHDMEELGFIHDHLREHYKCSTRPMPPI